MARPRPEIGCAVRALGHVSRRRFLFASSVLGMSVLAGHSSRYAFADDPAVSRIRAYCDVLLQTMKQAKELGVQGRFDKLAPVIQATFDLDAMTRIAVGPEWTSIPQDQQQALVANFKRMTVATYANRFDGYAGERFDVEPQTEARKADRIVRTKLIHPDGHFDTLNYLMRGSGNVWKVVDVYLSGTISELATRRSEFGAILKSGGPTALIESLRQRSAKLLQSSAGALTFAALLAGCAAQPTDPQAHDPYERGNRAMFNVNESADKAVIEPVAKGYRAAFPEWVQNRVRNFSDNLNEPRIFVNTSLQARIDAAGTTFARFLVNTTVGVLGLFDVATFLKLPRQTGDFGQTLARWGVGDGPYIVLPFFGPSNVRDSVGFVGDLAFDLYANPGGALITGEKRIQISIAQEVISAVDLRARNIETVDALRETSLDYYAQMRSITRQRREAEVREAKGLPEEPQEELLDPGSPP